MAPFDLLDYDDPDVLDRLFGNEPKRNAYVELHNLIAAAGHAREFGPEHRDRIGRAHEVDLTVAFADERRDLYARYLAHCLGDGALTPGEREALAHLARTLALGVGDLDPVHAEAWGQTVSDALTDDCLDVGERLLLYTMQHALGLDPGRAEAVYEEAARTALLRRVAHALCDGELSDEEAAEIDALAAGIDVEIPDDVRPMMERAAYRWQLRCGETLPRIDLPLQLSKNEVGHFAGMGAWFEVDFGRMGVMGRERAVAELEAGDTTEVKMSGAALRSLDAGTIYVTDRRLVLAGVQRKPTTLKFYGLLGAERFQDGVRIVRKKGYSLFLRLEDSHELLFLVLSRVLKRREA